MTLPVVRIPWAEFAPDLSDYTPGASDAIKNVEPMPDGYGSLPSFQTFGTSIGSRVRGAIAARLTNGSSSLFAGTATKLYRFAAGTASWADFTRDVGIGTPDNYALATADTWSMVQYGNRIVAANYTDETQYINVDSGSEFDDLPNAPKCKYLAVVGDFLVAGFLTDLPTTLRWSGNNDSEFWTIGQRGADQQLFPDGGPIAGIVGHSAGGVVFQRDKIRLMERVQTNLIFTFRTLHENLGCFAPGSIVQVRNTFFWYDQSGFYEGMEATPIGDNKVNKWLEEQADAVERKAMRGALDPVRNIVWWSVTKTDGSRLVVGFDFLTRRWTQMDSNVDLIFSAITPGYTIDDLGTLGYTMDTIPFPFDSAFWQGTGALVLAGFNSTGAFGYFQGNPLQAELETADMELNPGGYAFLNSGRVVIDADNSAVSCVVGARQRHGQGIVWGASQAIGDTGRFWTRSRAITHRIRTTVASTSWRNTTGIEIYAARAGQR